RLAQIRPVGAPADKLALLELRHRARDLGLVHVGVGTDRLAGHDAVLAESDENTPFRYSNTVAAVDARERLRHQARQHVEPVGEKILELEQRGLRLRRIDVRRVVSDWTGVRHHPRPYAAVG